MKRFHQYATWAAVTGGLFFSGTALAADEAYVVTEDSEGSSTLFNNDMDDGNGHLKDEVIGIKPQIGALRFEDPANASSSRLASGVTLDFNVARGTNLYFGPSTGFLYSNLGNQGGNFFGGGGSSSSGFMMIVPANLKLGVNLGEHLRLSAHGGGNIVRSSNPSAVSLGRNNTDDSQWGIFPNVGADLEVGLTRSFGLFVRPDVTLTRGSDLYTGTVGLSLILG